MKKIYLIMASVCLLLVSGNLNAQIVNSGFESWTSGKPDGWYGTKSNISADSIAQYATSVHGGASACKLQNSSTTHKRFTTQGVPIVAGKTYQISFWVRGQGEIRTGCYKGAGSAGSTYYTYNSYIIVNDLNWTQQSQTITVDTTSAIAQFIISIRSTKSAKDHLQIDDVIIDTVGLVPPTAVSIKQIQYTTAPTGDSPLANQQVTTRGIVTGKHSKGLFIQDTTGAWHGIYVYDSVTAQAVSRGDLVEVTGLVVEYNGLTEIKNVSNYTILNNGLTEPLPLTVNSASMKSEASEGVLVKVFNATCTDVNAGYGMWTVSDGDTMKIHNLLYAFTPTLNVHYDVTGPVYYTFQEYRIEPREAADVEISSAIDENNQERISIYPNPASNYLMISNHNLIEKVQITNLVGQKVLVQNMSENNNQVDISSLNKGIYFISLIRNNTTVTTLKFSKN